MRTAFVAASLLCTYFAYESVHIRRSQVHKKAIDTLNATEGARISTLPSASPSLKNYRLYNQSGVNDNDDFAPFCFEWPRVSDMDRLEETLGMGDERLECIYDLPNSTDDSFLERIHIDELRTVSFVDLGKTQITDTSIRKLSGLPHLRYLILDDTSVGDEGIAPLQNCKYLKYLKASRVGITDESLATISTLSRLDSLVINGNAGITPSGLRTYLPHLSNLHYLGVSDMPLLGDEAFSCLAGNFPELGLLYANDTGVSDEVLKYIGAADGELHVLTLKNNQITGDTFHHLFNHPELFWVDLSGNPLHEEGVKHLALMSSLKYLQLHEVALTSNMLQMLGQSTILELLELEHSPGIDDQSMRILAEYSALRTLHINGTAVTMDGIRYLCEHANGALEYIKFDASQVSDAQVNELKERGNRVVSRGNDSTIRILYPGLAPQ